MPNDTGKYAGYAINIGSTPKKPLYCGWENGIFRSKPSEAVKPQRRFKMSKKRNNGTKVATTKKTDVVGAVDNDFTNEELTYMAQFISEFSEIGCSLRANGVDEDNGEPVFSLEEVKKVCFGNGSVLTVDLLLPELEYFLCFAEDVPEYIQKGCPYSRVTDRLIRWYSEFFLPRIKRLPSIYASLQSKEEVWEWVKQEAQRAGTDAKRWVRMVVLGQRDQVLGGVVDRIDGIRSTIHRELFG
jgi:hypothetical protein